MDYCGLKKAKATRVSRLTAEERRGILNLHNDVTPKRKIGQIVCESHVFLFRVIRTFESKSRIAPAVRPGPVQTIRIRLHDQGSMVAYPGSCHSEAKRI